ncbi:Hypothetical_protein [Hexamita inflata]|uniref:Hypothetical_protein n=1 Tax=Hexamita inflata TaxID=28002 RepID=A0AA86PVH3_9EUKA|nr:Hypothetical protein HINF_LOCUS32547 [Hexamita inflata]
MCEVSIDKDAVRSAISLYLDQFAAQLNSVISKLPLTTITQPFMFDNYLLFSNLDFNNNRIQSDLNKLLITDLPQNTLSLDYSFIFTENGMLNLSGAFNINLMNQSPTVYKINANLSKIKLVLHLKVKINDVQKTVQKIMKKKKWSPKFELIIQMDEFKINGFGIFGKIVKWALKDYKVVVEM